jgi:hypothetical protein
VRVMAASINSNIASVPPNPCVMVQNWTLDRLFCVLAYCRATMKHTAWFLAVVANWFRHRVLSYTCERGISLNRHGCIDFLKLVLCLVAVYNARLPDLESLTT